jgi:apolipoprotein N-acyltransferase
MLTAVAFSGAIIVTLSGVLVPLDSAAEAGVLRVGVAQGSVPNLGLDSFGQARRVLENHVSATEEMAEHLEWTPDLVIWPENAADYDPRVDSITRDQVTMVARLIGAPLLLGTQDTSPPDGRYNVALLWTEEGEVIGVYAKRHPAPFAEYIPWRSFARIFSSAVDRVHQDMLAGTEVGLVKVPVERFGRDVGLGDVICFEVAYDAIVRDAIRAGGEVLVVQTNNASFGMSPESEQQLAMTRIRAVETGRSAIQSSTVGVSAIVAPNGEIIDRTGLFTADYMLEEVPLRTSLTPAMRVGAFVNGAFLLAPVVAIIALGLAKLKGRWEWD